MTALLYETFSPQIAEVVSIENPWGAAGGQRVRVKVNVRNNHWLPQMLRVDFKALTPSKTYYSGSQTNMVLPGTTVPYTFYFTMPYLPPRTRIYLDSSMYQIVLGRAKYVHGLEKSMEVSATPVIMPLGG